jgi:hypothetical protein
LLIVRSGAATITVAAEEELLVGSGSGVVEEAEAVFVITVPAETEGLTATTISIVANRLLNMNGVVH